MSKPTDTSYKGIKKYVLTSGNAERLADSLCKMRGAALKLGQVLSTFEDSMVPPLIKNALERARAQADILPEEQLLETLEEGYGKDWRKNFSSFDMEPIAAASIGQVHSAVLKENGQRVAIKIQYPGIADSIDQDLDNFKRIVKVTNIIPKGLFIDTMVESIRVEFKDECDYLREADKLIKYKAMLKDAPYYYVPNVYKEYSRKRVLCMEYVEGEPIDKLTHQDIPQDLRDFLGHIILELCLRELFMFHFMQTDPNPANFFYDSRHKRLILIDLGAGKIFDKQFVDNYMGIVHGAAQKNPKEIVESSQRIGLLTGEESKRMVQAHVNAALALGEAFSIKDGAYYDFSTQEATEKVYALLPIMLENRLSPPPGDVIPLHRKLSGAFLQMVRLKSKVKTRDMFMKIYDQWKKQHIALSPQ
ncbi:MAG: AarF/ABC1/UbiB kinase family protein [Candidatus Pacebacteria bacterium]|nr:AarF/ABC1/UbiB kinase family protein [Candidatus Paceibacterota bacterium]